VPIVIGSSYDNIGGLVDAVDEIESGIRVRSWIVRVHIHIPVDVV